MAGSAHGRCLKYLQAVTQYTSFWAFVLAVFRWAASP
jgi:hypothetical protein